MEKEYGAGQCLWGVALILAGIGVFFRVSSIMPKIASIDHFSSVTWLIRGSFYFLGLLLIFGGGQKLYRAFSQPDKISKET